MIYMAENPIRSALTSLYVIDALAVAGCDYVILGPKVLKALNEAPTAQGYNDGLSAQSTETGLARVLSPKTPSSGEVKAWKQVDQKVFDELIGMAGKELVDQVCKEPIVINITMIAAFCVHHLYKTTVFLIWPYKSSIFYEIGLVATPFTAIVQGYS